MTAGLTTLIKNGNMTSLSFYLRANGAKIWKISEKLGYYWERCGHDHDRMVVGFATTCVYHH
jgi:hypothetical protein